MDDRTCMRLHEAGTTASCIKRMSAIQYMYNRLLLPLALSGFPLQYMYNHINYDVQ